VAQFHTLLTQVRLAASKATPLGRKSDSRKNRNGYFWSCHPPRSRFRTTSRSHAG